MNKCGYCGLFFSWNSDWDQYTPFGSCSDLEPPDPVFMCEKCSKKEEDEFVEQGRVFSNWMRSKAERRAAKRLGLVSAGPKGAAWGQWFSPDSVPAGYEVRND